ncbi:hypothetical protein V5739_01415 [Salinimicrobium sp. TIG7-5_MAKvit]|uniref:hypothetical protein n=1 Tax=Salinimicrobium sp. TIG7-5_MAKvit TaxID=3121289 RepID=UPI003C6E727F
MFLEKFKATYFKKLDELEFDGNDLENILKSNVFNHLEKKILIDNSSNEIITSNLVVLELLSSLLIQYDNFEVNNELLKIISLSKNVPTQDRIKIFSLRLEKQDEEFIDKFLMSLGKDYERITFKDRRPKVLQNSHNELLLQTLKKQEYISSFSKTVLGFRVHHWRKR